MRHIFLSLSLLLSTPTFAMTEIDDNTMSNSQATGIEIVNGEIQMPKDVPDFLNWWIPSNNVQYFGVTYDEAAIQFMLDGSIRYNLPDIEEIRMNNFLGIGDFQFLGIKAKGGYLEIKPK